MLRKLSLLVALVLALAAPVLAVTPFASPVDNARSTLAAPRSIGGSTVTLAAGYGDTIRAQLTALGLPSISSTHPLRFTLVKAAAIGGTGVILDPTKVCVYKATGLTGDVLSGVTVDSGTDQAFAIGDRFGVFATSKSLIDLHSAVNTLEGLEATTVYTNGSYSDPAWITSLAGSKLTGSVVATNGVVTTGSYADPSWLTSLASSKLTGTVATARLGSGTADATTYLRGDQTWQAISSGLTIGSTPVGGGTAGRVLFEGAGPVVADSSRFTYDGSTFSLQSDGTNDLVQWKNSGGTRVAWVNSGGGVNVVGLTAGQWIFTGTTDGFRSTGSGSWAADIGSHTLNYGENGSGTDINANGNLRFYAGGNPIVCRTKTQIGGEHAATDVALAVRAASSQSADIVQVQDNTGTPIARTYASGALQLPHLADAAAPNDSWYFSTDSSKASYKDAGGTAHPLY